MIDTQAAPDYRRQRQIVRERLRARRRQERRPRLAPVLTPRSRVFLLGLGLALAAFTALSLRRFAISPSHRSAVSPSRRLAVSLSRPLALSSALPFTVAVHGAMPSVELSDALRRAIRRQWPGYRLPPTAAIHGEALEEMRDEHPDAHVPYAVLGDFNGDGRPDAALLLRRGPRAALVAFQATARGGYEGHRLLRTRWSDGFYIVRQPAGSMDCNHYQSGVADGTETVILRSDGIRFSPVEAAAQVYYFEAGHYRHVEVGE